jgi:hypothetical protein
MATSGRDRCRHGYGRHDAPGSQSNGMKTLTFDSFRTQALDEGFDEVLERDWPALTELATHTHPFSVKARVSRGEMWLTVGDSTQHLRAGDAFELARDVPHAERYGPEGATYWVARRNR